MDSLTQNSKFALQGRPGGKTQNSLIVRRVETIEEYQACQRIHRQVWGFNPEDTVMHLPLMVALQEYGGLVLGAFVQGADGAEEQVGFVVGFIGRDPATGRFFHYSQTTGAVTEWQSRGVGFALKTAQRREVLKQGYDLVRWSYDPLEARNAYFNLAKLGGVARRYLPNMYGTGKGELFGQLDTDRLIVDWELESERVNERLGLAALDQKPAQPVQDYMEFPAVVEVEWLAPGIAGLTGIDLDRAEPGLRLEIPYQKKAVQKHDYRAAETWRSQTRALFTYYLEAGYYVADFFTFSEGENPRAFYVLQSGENK